MIPNLTTDEKAVYDCIVNSNGRVTQLQISRAAPNLGSSAKHEGYLSHDSTLRKIREIIRTLRLKHKMQILSDKKGYFLKRTDEDAKTYMETLERSAKASAKSFMVTYAEMSKILGIRSDFFEKQGKLFEDE